MHIKLLLVLAICFSAIHSYKLLKGKDIPSNYEIGMISRMEYVGNDKIYFATRDDVFGLMNATTGALLSVFELEDDENILEQRGSQFLIIEKNRDINLLVPKDQTYFKLKYSEYLQKENFKKIFGLRRFFRHDYILTDQFVAKGQHFLIMKGDAITNQTEEQRFEIIYRKTEANDVHQKLISFVDGRQPQLGLVVFNQKNNQKSICVIKLMNPKFQRVCASINKNLKILGVVEGGQGIQVRTQKNNLIYRISKQKLQFVEQIKFRDIATHFSALNKEFQNKNKKKNGTNPQQKQLNQMSYVPPGHVAINVYERYVLVRRDDTILANIDKKPQDFPVYHQAYKRSPESPYVDIVMIFADGRVVCYEINEKNTSYFELWKFKTTTADKSIQGEKRQAKESNLQAQQDLEQIEKKDDIEINKDGNNQL